MQIQKEFISLNRTEIIQNPKNKINKKIKNSKFPELTLLLPISLISSSLAPSISTNNEIILKIDGIGNRTFVEQSFCSKIKSLEINNGKQSEITNFFDFKEKNNIVKIIFNSRLTNCNRMFYALETITGIDLSLFDFSEVTDMTSMFQNCSSLNTIISNGGNMNKVKSMSKLFLGCINLISLDLSKIIARNVENMIKMLENCIQFH